MEGSSWLTRDWMNKPSQWSRVKEYAVKCIAIPHTNKPDCGWASQILKAVDPRHGFKVEGQEV